MNRAPVGKLYLLSNKEGLIVVLFLSTLSHDVLVSIRCDREPWNCSMVTDCHSIPDVRTVCPPQLSVSQDVRTCPDCGLWSSLVTVDLQMNPAVRRPRSTSALLSRFPSTSPERERLSCHMVVQFQPNPVIWTTRSNLPFYPAVTLTSEALMRL